jgi:Raf kinase inhibitor-like YbhB/YbcL family protein
MKDHDLPLNMEINMRKVLLIVLSLLSFSVFAEDAPKNVFTLNTNAFLDQGALPVLYTCDGKDVSPALDWINVPAKTQGFAVTVTDPDAPGGTFYHWVVYNIPKATTKLDEGVSKLPAGSLIGKNGWEKPQYNGPCPPKGSAHTYTITLYALDGKLNLPEGTDAKTVVEALDKHNVGKASLTTVYSRWLK